MIRMLPDGQLCALATNGAATPPAMSVRLVSMDPSRRFTPLQRLLRRTLARRQRSSKPSQCRELDRTASHLWLGQGMPAFMGEQPIVSEFVGVSAAAELRRLPNQDAARVGRSPSRLWPRLRGAWIHLRDLRALPNLYAAAPERSGATPSV